MGYNDDATRSYDAARNRASVIAYNIADGPPAMPYPTDPPRPSSDVWNQVHRALENIGLVGDLIQKLHGRLEPVLRPTPPAIGGSGAGTQPVPVTSPLACELDRLAGRVDALRRDVLHLLERVDL